ncbi:MAG: hypothetical protein MJE77_30565 [Proteobacteria bacterium]|nr:hypothetical protein [Pseudomonadota bacterium]
MKRRDFLLRVGGIALATPIMANLAACDDDEDGDTPDAAAKTCNSVGTEIGNNSIDNHQLTVPAADVTAGVQKEYTLTLGAGHTHRLTVTSANFQTLLNDGMIQLTSTNDDSHTHSVTLTCSSS